MDEDNEKDKDDLEDWSIVHGIRVAKCWKPETFGRLTTIGPPFRLPCGGKRKRCVVYQVCQCVCGAFSLVRRGNLQQHTTKSCGCLQKDAARTTKTTHGETKNNRRSAEYRAWADCNSRCHNPGSNRYYAYGARGIKVCDRWLGPEGYQNFLADMGRRPSPQHSIDRIDVNGDYCPENCRWATRVEQANNTRTNRLVSHKGETFTLSQWAHEIGIPYKTLYARLQAGWSVEKAFNTPISR